MSAFCGWRRAGAVLAVALACGSTSGTAVAAPPHATPAAKAVLPMTVAPTVLSPLRPSGSPVVSAAKVKRGITYAGSTSADDPIMIGLARDGKSVRQIASRFEARCASTQQEELPSLSFFAGGATKLKIASSGRFAGANTKTETVGDIVAREIAVLNGRVTGRKMSGSLTLHADLTDAAGAAVGTCDETATFKAVSTPDRVFGGTTSGHGPVVVELATNGRAVRHFHIGWQATCTRPDGSRYGFQYGDTLVSFPISKGRFGDDFTQDYSEPGGETETLTYSLHGRVARGKVTGTFRVQLLLNDASGATFATCDSGALTYRASSG